MEFEIGKIYKQEEVKNQYRLRVSFVPTNEEINLNIKDTKELELIIKTYELFKEKEEDDWDEYCEPIYEHIEECILEVAEEINYDKSKDSLAIRALVRNIWAQDYTNECYARVYDWELTYFDGNSIQYHVDIIN